MKSSNDKQIKFDSHLDIIDSTRKHSILYKEDIIEQTENIVLLFYKCLLTLILESR